MTSRSGEHRRVVLFVLTSRGSSPRTWGTLTETVAPYARLRLIPTHVGNTGPAGADVVGDPAHPHARGEHARSRADTHARTGSSPRTWGTHRQGESPRAVLWLIPTHVGNTCRQRHQCWKVTAHPHARGEHASDSPARTVPVRLIPTHVGNTRRSSGTEPGRTAHPHARGEQVVKLGLGDPVGGSSPRTWGTRDRHLVDPAVRRLIPTPVGNTSSTSRRARWAPAHPHARGEHFKRIAYSDIAAGSSPRPWGTQFQGRASFSGFRLIPTHVGNTPGARTIRRSATAHPHARGEHAKPSPRLCGNRGSSPRTWGTRHRDPQAVGDARLIPTHVGNTSRHRLRRRSRSAHPHARGEHQWRQRR